MTDNLLITYDTINLVTLDNALDILLYSLSDASQRQYMNTFKRWIQFCDTNKLPHVAMTANNLITFLESEKLVNMQHHNYDLEPNVHFTPDGKSILFRANFEGKSQIYRVDINK